MAGRGGGTSRGPFTPVILLEKGAARLQFLRHHVFLHFWICLKLRLRNNTILRLLFSVSRNPAYVYEHSLLHCVRYGYFAYPISIFYKRFPLTYAFSLLIVEIRAVLRRGLFFVLSEDPDKSGILP